MNADVRKTKREDNETFIYFNVYQEQVNLFYDTQQISGKW